MILNIIKIRKLSASIILTLIVSTMVSGQSKFGQLPKGERLDRIKKSSNYGNRSFQNLSPTPIMTKSEGRFKIFWEFMFKKNRKPKTIIPTVQTNLKELSMDKDVLVWFGHSSYFIQIDGKKILVDPVLSKHASPFSFSIRAFKGTNIYKTDDIPYIDYLIITHDHWDHLDKKTIMKLKDQTGKIICGLGVGSHLEFWGFDKAKIIEKDWNEVANLDSGFIAHCLPSRHFSGRGTKRDQTLWVSWLLQTPSMKIYMGGDGGYDKHFEDIGKKYGDIDLAILENGQYNPAWKHIHLLPDETLKAAQDLRAKQLLPVHSSRFALALHSWNEPLNTLMDLNKNAGMNIITPQIGEVVNLKDSTQIFKEWWK